jgi:uncharacterized protein YjbJ (UPF0337 family)
MGRVHVVTTNDDSHRRQEDTMGEWTDKAKGKVKEVVEDAKRVIKDAVDGIKERRDDPDPHRR